MPAVLSARSEKVLQGEEDDPVNTDNEDDDDKELVTLDDVADRNGTIMNMLGRR